MKNIVTVAATWTDVYGAAFEPNTNVVDFAGATQFRIIYSWHYAGTGSEKLRWVNKANNAEALYTTVGFQADQDGIDTGWRTLPAAFSGSVAKAISMQYFDDNAGSIPAIHWFTIYLK